MDRFIFPFVILAAVSSAAAQPPPPAPMATTARDDIVRMLRRPHPERCLPFTISTTDPVGVIRREGNDWVLRRLSLDRAAADREGRRRRAAGRPWMPENVWAFLRPGSVIARARSAAELATAIAALSDWAATGLGPAQAPQPRTLCPAAG